MLRRTIPLTIALGLLAAIPALAADGPTPERSVDAQAEPPRLDVPFVPTREEVVRAMLDIAGVTERDVVYDLGSGDGRIVIAAAKERGARGVGVDINPDRIAEGREGARRAGIEDRVQFVQGNLFEADIGDATVVTLYLLPEVNLKLRPKLLRELRPGTRVVSHSFDMGEWMPDRTVQVGRSTVYLWIVPADVAGTWTFRVDGTGESRVGTLRLRQAFQGVSGSARIGGEEIPITEATLRGAELTLIAGPYRLRARVDGGVMQGVVDRGSGTAARSFVASRQAAGLVPPAP